MIQYVSGKIKERTLVKSDMKPDIKSDIKSDMKSTVKSNMNPDTNSACLKYVSALLLFGTNGLVASCIHLSSYEIVFLRTMIGSITLIALFLLTGQKLTFLQNRKQLFFLLLSGMAMGLSWMFLYEAYQQIGVSIASLLYYCGPVIVILFSPLIFKEKLTALQIPGFLSVLIGLFLVNGGLIQQNYRIWGLFCGAMSAAMYALMIIFNKKSKDITGLENSMLQLTFAFLTVAVFMGFSQRFVIHVDPSDRFPVLFLGIINTGLGCYLYFSPLSKLPVRTVTVLGYLEPLSAVVFSALLLHETMRGSRIAGVFLILGGAVFTEYSQSFQSRKKS